MSDKKVYSEPEMKVWIKHVISEMPKHETSPKTERKIEKIYEAMDKMQKSMPCSTNQEMIKKHHLAIYGDEEDSTNPGMKVKIDELHNFFIGTRGATKLVVYFFGAIGTITAGFYALKSFIKYMSS